MGFVREALANLNFFLSLEFLFFPISNLSLSLFLLELYHSVCSMKWAGPIIFVGFLSLGASMILQLLVSFSFLQIVE